MGAVSSSLMEFLTAGLRPRTPLGHAIRAALLVKLVVIILMRVFLFSGDDRPVDDARMIESRLLGDAPSRLPRLPTATD